MQNSHEKDSSSQSKGEASGAKYEQQAPKTEAINHLLELIADVKVAMFTTQDKDGNLHSRPMQTVDSSPDGTFWFFTSDHNGKADEVGVDPRVNLSYAMPEKNRYVSVSGLGEIVHDLAKKKELWKPIYKAWFPEGVDDAHCALMKVHIEKAEYWDTPSSKFVEIVGFTKALLTGHSYKVDEGEHQKINFDGKSDAAAADQKSV
ncbi:MAG: pyridoxamine 5'-phosphate oxidase family protein [Chitinophagaceae bacterium]|nr:pyridoxamine 5'-phosphate oxidase family protein [Oligoflexus sp.]